MKQVWIILFLGIFIFGSLGCHDTAKPPQLIIDNGNDGIGVIRGNSNGNLHNKGRSLCDGLDIYYVDQESDPVCICKYDLSSKEMQVLVEFKNEELSWNIGFLNLIGTNLYYVDGIFNKDVQSVFQVSISDKSLKRIGDFSGLRFFLAAYDKLFITDDDGTLICDMNGNGSNRLDGLYLSGVMNGLLYGYRMDLNGCFAVDLDGKEIAYYTEVENPIPLYGRLIELDNLYGESLEYKGKITMVDVASNESKSFLVPEIYCANYYNVSKNAVYLQRYGEDETGEIYLIDWEGKGFRKVDDRIFTTGVSLWGDIILADYVPCDELM